MFSFFKSEKVVGLSFALLVTRNPFSGQSKGPSQGLLQGPLQGKSGKQMNRWRTLKCYSLLLVLLFPFLSHSDQLESAQSAETQTITQVSETLTDKNNAGELLTTKNHYKLLVLGDSLSAAYGLTKEQGWVYLLRAAWEGSDKPISVINGAISGDTTDGGLARLPRLLDLHKPTHLLIELGGNDGLQGHHPRKIKSNLESMISLATDADVRVMLQEIQIPTNYGRRYTTMFANVFDIVATKQDIPLIPFFLEEIALNKALMQNDGIHPTAEAQPMIVDFMKPKLEALILD